MVENDGHRPHIYNYINPDSASAELVSGKALDDFVREGLEGARWVYLERETGGDCVLLTSLDMAVPSAYTAGRAFGPAYELRWQAVARGTFSMQLLTEQTLDWEGFIEAPYHFDWAEREPYRILLLGTLASELKDEHRWGGNDEHVWIETRIPRPLEYPVAEPTKQVAVLARDYCVNGVTIATRWLSLEGVTS